MLYIGASLDPPNVGMVTEWCENGSLADYLHDFSKPLNGRMAVQLALEVLSYSELEAVKYIFGEIEGSEGFLIASKLAEEYKLTRSVIVNALRKLESAGVIDARSLGMKGTYIKVLNDYLYEELEKV